MNNSQQPRERPHFSNLRAASPANLSSALSRRNATRRSFEQSRGRRYQSPVPPVPPRIPDELSSKRRRIERSGQVQMEQLSMELRYCDGGRYDGPVTTRDYSPECALRDDSSVYCTKSSRCNMLLRHIDGDCFSVQKLVIRAPAFGYTSPVQAGMIFVAMDETDLLSRTNYTVRYESDDDEGGSDDEAYDLRFLESDPCEPPYPIGMDSYGGPVYPSDLPTTPPSPHNPNLLPRGGAPSLSPLWANVGEQINQSRPPPAELLKPDATFRHRGENSKWVIMFEPAISGRYILTKFFSTPDQKNIDIEFVGAYGWVGRRFFPAIDMR